MRRWEATAYRPFARGGAGDRRGRARGRGGSIRRCTWSTIPNGVDAAHFAPAAGARASRRAVHRRARRAVQRGRGHAAGASGSCRSCGARSPDAHLTIVGRKPGPRVRALGRVVAERPRPAAVAVGRRGLRVPDGERHRDQEQAAGGDGGGRAGGGDAARHARASTHRSICSSPTPTRRSPPALVDAAPRPATRRAAGRGGARVRARPPRLGRGRRRGLRSFMRDRNRVDGTRFEPGDLGSDERAVGRQRRPLDAAEPAAPAGAAARRSRSSSRATSARPTWAARATSRSSRSRSCRPPRRASPAALSRFVGELLGARRGGQAMSLYRFTRRVELVAAALVLRCSLVAVALLGGDPRAAWVLAGSERRARGPAGRADEPAGGRAALARGLAARARHRRRHRAADDRRARGRRRDHRAVRGSRPRRSSPTSCGPRALARRLAVAAARARARRRPSCGGASCRFAGSTTRSS